MKKFKESGFTLIELLMVMMLMVLITTITVTGSFGMSRAASYTAAQDLVYNTLQIAKQRACLDGKPVFVVFQDFETILVVEGVGTVSKILKDGGSFFDRTATFEIKERTDGKSTNVTIWNLTTGAHAGNVIATPEVEGTDTIPGLDVSADFGFVHCRITPRKDFNKSEWNERDAYGFEVMPAKKLPKGFRLKFGSAKDNAIKNEIIVFNPDGTGGVGKKDSNGKIVADNSDAYIDVYEKIKEDDPGTYIGIIVSSGVVSFNKKGK